jgi:hypothetical protein
MKKRHVVFKILTRADVKHPKGSVREIYTNADMQKDRELETKVFAIKSKHLQMMKKKTVSWYVQWSFVVMDGDNEKSRKIGKPDPTPKLSKAAQMVAAQMNAYDDSDEEFPDATVS